MSMLLIIGSMLFCFQASCCQKTDFFYKTSIGKTLRYCLSTWYFSAILGWCADRRWSTCFIPWFIRKNSINMDEAINKDPSAYITFNDFFTRKLRSDARCIDQATNAFVSPADGIVYTFENIQPQNLFFIKNKKLNLGILLKNKELAQQFVGGTLTMIYLAPHDYHRFHFPIDCSPHNPYRIAGKYESVAPFVYKFIQPLTENERHYVILDENTIMMAIGAMCVGKIAWTYQKNSPIKKGDEAGLFKFGGSTIVLLNKKDSLLLEKEYKNARGIPIQMGVKLGRYLSPLVLHGASKKRSEG
jgi:phosphatidylserine decarboxylase